MSILQRLHLPLRRHRRRRPQKRSIPIPALRKPVEPDAGARQAAVPPFGRKRHHDPKPRLPLLFRRLPEEIRRLLQRPLRLRPAGKILGRNRLHGRRAEPADGPLVRAVRWEHVCLRGV